MNFLTRLLICVFNVVVWCVEVMYDYGTHFMVTLGKQIFWHSVLKTIIHCTIRLYTLCTAYYYIHLPLYFYLRQASAGRSS